MGLFRGVAAPRGEVCAWYSGGPEVCDLGVCGLSARRRSSGALVDEIFMSQALYTFRTGSVASRREGPSVGPIGAMLPGMPLPEVELWLCLANESRLALRPAACVVEVDSA